MDKASFPDSTSAADSSFPGAGQNSFFFRRTCVAGDDGSARRAVDRPRYKKTEAAEQIRNGSRRIRARKSVADDFLSSRLPARQAEPEGDLFHDEFVGADPGHPVPGKKPSRRGLRRKRKSGTSVRGSDRGTRRRKSQAARRNKTAENTPHRSGKLSGAIRIALYCLMPLVISILMAGTAAAFQQSCALTEGREALGLVLVGGIGLFYLLIPLVRFYDPGHARNYPWKVLGRVTLMQIAASAFTVLLVGLVSAPAGQVLYCM